jgi:hypothetical protein
MRAKRGFLLLIAAAVCFALISSCSVIPNGTAADRVIFLTIGDSGGSRLVEVAEYDVTSLDVEIFDPDGELLWSTEWLAENGPQTYQIQVEQPGDHEIVLVHHGMNGEEDISATESAVFSIAGMMITVINVTPGAIGVLNISGGVVEDQCPLVGTWEGTINVVMEEYNEWGEVIETYEIAALVHMEFHEDGTAVMFTYLLDDFGEPYSEPVEDFTFRGTYECPVDGLLNGAWTEWYNTETGEWELAIDEDQLPDIVPDPDEWDINVEFQDDGDTLILDMTEIMGVYWTLHRV